MSESVDVVVLGGGSGGYACALRAAQLGLSVVLVEAGKLGGTCLHSGCIPTKALLHVAEVAQSAREAHVFGVDATLNSIDMAAADKYKSGVVNKLHRGLEGLIASRGITVVSGRGTLVDRNTVDVDGVRYRGEALVLATGSESRTIPGLDIGKPIVTSEQALNLDAVPARVVVVGGGVIGVEFASVWRSFGSEVTIVEALPRLVAAEDEWSSKQLERALRKRGITVRTGVSFASSTVTDSGVELQLGDGSAVAADLVLVAVGRGPRTAGMGFEDVGVHLEQGFVTVDDMLETSVPGIYAVGDIVAGLQLAHRGFAQGILVAEYLAGLSAQPLDESGIPRVTYSDPEVASVGLTETAAREKYGDVTTAVYDLAGNGKSQILQTSGGIKLVRAGADGPVVGLHMVGARVGELIGEAQAIYNWEAMPEDVARLVHAHPTQNEALGEAHMALAGKALHAHS